jgi:hypothetical protein
MRLWLLMYRRYPPYSKWLGTAFTRGLRSSLPAGCGHRYLIEMCWFFGRMMPKR